MLQFIVNKFGLRNSVEGIPFVRPLTGGRIVLLIEKIRFSPYTLQ